MAAMFVGGIALGGLVWSSLVGQVEAHFPPSLIQLTLGGLAVSLGLLPFAFGLPRLPIVPIGPGFYPTIVLVFMAAMSRE